MRVFYRDGQELIKVPDAECAAWVPDAEWPLKDLKASAGTG